MAMIPPPTNIPDSAESKSSNAIESVFPDVLKGPILRKVQFAVISRIDDLVNTIFDEFKRDFYPGEEVTVTFDDGEQYNGMIREKAQFPMIRGPNGEVQRKAFSRYFVPLKEMGDREALLDDSHIRRDRKIFTKQNLRSFLKHSLQRESWNGAPWLAKEPLAIQYHLSMEIPAHLMQDAKLLQQKELQRQALAHQQLPPIKYPIEDLDISPKRNGVTRPTPQFWTEEMYNYVANNRRTSFDDTEMSSMGLLLEVWNTLNVQCEVYVLDSFTFDDFVDAMQYQAESPTCELLNEVHCAVLKQLVDGDGKLMIKMAELVKDTGSDDSDEDDSQPSTPHADAPAHSTRSRLSHVDLNVDHPRSPTTFEKAHRASEMLSSRDWKTRLAERDFERGGWQIILVGLLYQLSANASLKSRCDRILAELAPIDLPPTQETARLQYKYLDINLRINALQVITMLSIGTKAVRDFLEQCSEDMTDVRKRKMECQRERKIMFDELQKKESERKALMPANITESPKLENDEPATNYGDIDDTIETNGSDVSEGDDGAHAAGRSLRRGNDRKRKRQEDAARFEKEKAEKLAAAKVQNKQSKEFKKVLIDIEDMKKKLVELEAKMVECDSDLREANVQRTKLLGQDRFCNRYYWYERNGQPYGGLPTSSTASNGYANGRIWIQGPDKHELEGFIGGPEDEKEYKAKHHVSIPERRRLEEGPLLLKDATEWAFYDDITRLDNLIGWLDERGVREKRLRKELCEWRDTIAQYMEAVKAFKDQEAARKVEANEEHATRINTRHKTYEEQSAAKSSCLRWTNSMAFAEQGHIHSRTPPPKRGQKKQKATMPQQRGVATVVNRQGMIHSIHAGHRLTPTSGLLWISHSPETVS
nr:imitation switch two complex protein 1 [Quercus suber]